MASVNVDALIGEAIDAHGGATLWNGLTALEAEISARGFLFAAKWRSRLHHVRVWASTREPRFIFRDFPRPGLNAELLGDEEVRVLDRTGKVVEQRRHPRQAFSGMRRQLLWDDLDFTYFGGYATWNYLVTPFVFLRRGFRFERLEAVAGAEGQLERVRVTFPSDIPTHCATQVFYFDAQRRLRRLDYTAEVIGGWAHAAHLCDQYREFGGLQIATRRRVWPLPFGSDPIRLPLLVGIDVHELVPIRA